MRRNPSDRRSPTGSESEVGLDLGLMQFWMFADVPFARLDAILLLIKTCLKGEMVDMLNAKDNQVFLDYLAGGQDARIAGERAANAVSGSALNVAARNATGAGEGAVGQAAGIQMEGFVSASVIQESISAARELTGQFRECKEAYVDFAQTRLEMEAKLHEQAVEFAKAKLEMEAKLNEQAQQHAKAMSEFDTLKAENDARLKAQDVDYLGTKAEIDERMKGNEVNHEATLLKMRLEHEMALAKVREEEEDKKLEREAKRARLGEAVAVVPQLRRSKRLRRVRI